MTEIQAVSELAKHLFDYLPGSSAWKGTYTFAHAARESGVGQYWQGGSKLPSLTKLLELTLEHKRSSFCPLVVRIVRNGISYRTKKDTPLTRTDIDTLNRLISKVGFKIPELWDLAFLDSLPASAPRAENQTPQTNASIDSAASVERRRVGERLGALKTRFFALSQQPDRNVAGLELETLLNELFDLHDLEPNEAFRVTGEQIDGSFLLDSEVYLLEAKWERPHVNEADLLVFRGKVEGKSSFTRGLFISVNGFSQPAISAITKGKQSTFTMMDGADLFRVLDGNIRLDDLLRRKVRYLAERGEPFVSVSEIFGTRKADT